jgi:hypothetical protein
MVDGQRSRRRRRRRGSAPPETVPGPASAVPAPDPAASPATGSSPPHAPSPAELAAAPHATEPVRPKPKRRAADNGTERGLRDLVGAGRSQLGVSGALRGRDVNRPTDEDLAEAEREVVVVRRNWRPPEAER